MAQGIIEVAPGKKVYVQAKGVKLKSNGKVLPIRDALEPMSKGERRRVRRSLSRMGRQDLASASV